MLHIYIYDISTLRVNDLTVILLTWRKWTPNNASKWQMGFNSAFKGLSNTRHEEYYNCQINKQLMYVTYIEAISYSHCCSGHSLGIIFCVCCRLKHPACNAHAPYCRLWFVRLYGRFLHYLTHGTNFERNTSDIKCVFWFSLQLLSETFLILRTEREVIKNVYWSSCEVPFIIVRF